MAVCLLSVSVCMCVCFQCVCVCIYFQCVCVFSFSVTMHVFTFSVSVCMCLLSVCLCVCVRHEQRSDGTHPRCAGYFPDCQRRMRDVTMTIQEVIECEMQTGKSGIRPSSAKPVNIVEQ